MAQSMNSAELQLQQQVASLQQQLAALQLEKVSKIRDYVTMFPCGMPVCVSCFSTIAIRGSPLRYFEAVFLLVIYFSSPYQLIRSLRK